MTKATRILAGALVASMAVAPVAASEDVQQCKDVEDESLGVIDGNAGLVVAGEDSGLWETTN